MVFGGGLETLVPAAVFSNKNAGGGGKCSKLPTGVKVLFVFVIEAVLLIGGGGLFPWTELRLNNVFRIVLLE